MKNIPVTLRSIIELGLGGDDWQTFVDHYEDRFDALQIDGFTFDPVSINYTFRQLLANVNATVLPTYVDPESEGFEMPLPTATGVTDNIPTQKLFYSVNRVIVREQMQLAQKFGSLALNDEMGDIIFGLLDEGTENLIQSFENALTHQRHQIVSTGSFSIDSTNNPRGIKGLTINFGFDTSTQKTTLTSTARWWTSTTHTAANQGSASDPIGDLKTWAKKVREDLHYYGPIALEISQSLMEDLLTHTKVLQAIGYALQPTSASDAAAQGYAVSRFDDEKIEVLRKLIGVDEIRVRETYAYVSAPDTTGANAPDLISTQITNFDPKNVAFVPTGKLGTIQGVQPISMGYQPENVAYAMGKRLLIETEDIPRTHSINVNGEMAQICVPNAIKQMYIATVTA